MRVVAGSIVAILIAGMLSACSSDPDKKPPPCPRVSILADTAKLTRFRVGGGQQPADMALEAEILKYRGSCEYDPGKKTMEVVLQVGFGVKLGPAATDRQANFSYFLAIPEFHPDPRAKALLPVSLTVADKTDPVTYKDDELVIHIPVPDIKTIAKYEMFLGLQMDAQELAYIREHRGQH
ncbi:MAG TPA: hypothetical protein HPP80_10330 [Rhodospirillaceae bacterium]|nr:hypothetical protein [Rhodospirillaceae bacterium]